MQLGLTPARPPRFGGSVPRGAAPYVSAVASQQPSHTIPPMPPHVTFGSIGRPSQPVAPAAPLLHTQTQLQSVFPAGPTHPGALTSTQLQAQAPTTPPQLQPPVFAPSAAQDEGNEQPQPEFVLPRRSRRIARLPPEFSGL
jgi:hypothetical protein